VYLATAAAIGWPARRLIALPLSPGMTMYKVLMTIVARVEARRDPGRRGGLGFLLPLVALAPLAFLSPVDRTWTAIAAALAAASILLASRHAAARPARIGIAVQGWLAAICVVDAMYLVALDEVAFAAVAAGCFVLTRLGHRVIVGT
ncbi:MAG: hypothetical protein KDA25_09735, partial [Phycisphaerales bacterium]|nr:hypothetical protein [Phycisphaerales bacterium]